MGLGRNEGRAVRRRAGISVVETLIVSALFFGLLTLLVAFFVKGQRMAVKTEAVSRVQHEASRLSRAVASDLYQSTWKWSQWSDGALIVLSSRPGEDDEPALEFQPLTGEVLWKKWVAFVLDPTTGEVRRHEVRLNSETADLSTLPLPVLNLTDLPALDPAKGKVVGRDILEFAPMGSHSSGTIEFRVKAGTEVALGNLKPEEKMVEVALSTTIRLGQF